MIDAPSNHPFLIPCVMHPNTNDKIAAAHKIWIVLSLKFYKTISKNVLGGLVIGALVPKLDDLQERSEESAFIPFYV